MMSYTGEYVSTYEWAKELATGLNRWANNTEKRGYFNRAYKLFNDRDKDIFMAGFNHAIIYDYEFTDEGY